MLTCVARAKAVRRPPWLGALLFGAAVLLASARAAAAPYPDGQPIKIVVGFGAGTGSDLQARALADAMARTLASPVIVENRPGAAGMLGASIVASAPPDGLTLAFGTTASMVTLPLLSRNAKYDTLRDFIPIATLARAPFIVLVANKPAAPNTLNELIARAHAGKLVFGSIGIGSFSQLASLRLLQAIGATATHVPYKSSPQELQDLAGGYVDFAVDSTTAALPLVHNGLLRALAVTSTTRLQSLPDVPTVAEVIGRPFENTVWTGLLAPARTPPEVIATLTHAIAAAQASAEIQTSYRTMELQPFTLDAAGFTALLRAEVPRWKTFFVQSDLHVDE